MKRSEIYRRAAKLIEDGSKEGCCSAIGKVERRTHAENNSGCIHGAMIDALGSLFNETSSAYWWPITPDGQNERILALCFMAAIAEDEEKRASK